MGNMYSMMFPPPPKLTEKNIGDQSGKVFIVTGSTSGVGEQLASVLYQKNGKVYVAARSEEKASKTIEAIKSRHPDSKGEIHFFLLDLNDLTTIKKSADEFLSKERRLDVLWLNAGVMIPPQGSKTAQGHELQLGTNNIAHFFFAKLMHPILAQTAKTAPANSVRIIWVSSSAVYMAPKPPIDFNNMDYKKDEGAWNKYARSKAGNVLHAVEFGKRAKEEGIVSIALNPGNLKTPLQRHVPRLQLMFMNWMLYDPIYGAYTELFAGLSPDITVETEGVMIQPWGRHVPARKDLLDPELGKKYWEWTEDQLKSYL